MANFKVVTPSDTPIIVHTVSPKFEAKLEGEGRHDQDWVGRIEWIDEHIVSKAVGKVQNNEPGLIEKADLFG